ncbi:tRNA/rRNA methyltransferase [Brucella suis]|nr:tRNA/rRNA methyltransferase [Brucella suis]
MTRTTFASLPYRDIREKDLVGRQQRFIAEGKVVLNVLFSSSARFETESLLVLEKPAGRIDRTAKAVAAGACLFIQCRKQSWMRSRAFMFIAAFWPLAAENHSLTFGICWPPCPKNLWWWFCAEFQPR